MSRPVAVLAALSLVILNACSRTPATRFVDRVHDFVALVASASFSAGSPYHVQPLPIVDGADDRDGVTFLRVPTGTHVTFDDRFAAPSASLRFGVGVGSVADGMDDRPVRFYVEVRDGEVPGSAWRRCFARTIDPTTLPRPDRYELHEVAFERDAPGRWSIRFGAEAATDDAGAVRSEWPGFIAPILSSSGRRVPVREPAILIDHVADDLVARLNDARRDAEVAESPIALAVLDAAKSRAGVGGRRTCIRMTAPARLSYRVTPVSGSELSFSYGVDTDLGWTKPGDDGMTFAVEIDGERVFEESLDPRLRTPHRGWKEARVELDRWAGREVELRLETEPRDDPRHDVGGFADVVVVRREERPRTAGRAAPTVVLIVVDTLRADRLGLYARDGASAAATPNLDRVARLGRVFRRARSAASWTWPSTASILTGLPPESHGVLDSQRSYLAHAHETLPELFARGGYTTAAVVTNLLIGAADNFDQGFETFVHVPFANARAVNDRVAAWLEESDGLARFLYLHYFDPHSPYRPPTRVAPLPEADLSMPGDADLLALLWTARRSGRSHEDAARWMETLRRRYDAEIEYFDHAFGELLALLERKNVLDDCILAFTSDHGEEFLEHGLSSHGPHIYEESVHVPLWITAFGRSRARVTPAVVEAGVENRRLFATLAELAGAGGVGSGDVRRGTSLVDDSRRAPVYLQSYHALEPGVDGRTEKLGVVVDERKLVFTPSSGRRELYDLTADPGETRDLAPARPDDADALVRLVEAWKSATATGGPLVVDDAAARRLLAELGYVLGE